MCWWIVSEHPAVASGGRPLSFQGRRHVTEMSLLKPDDSLAAHEDLASLAMLSFQPAAESNVTKLVLPTELETQLDPSQLPRGSSDDSQTIYHVTTTAKDSQVAACMLNVLQSRAL